MFKAKFWELKDKSPETKQKLISPEKVLFCACDRLGIIHLEFLIYNETLISHLYVQQIPLKV